MGVHVRSAVGAAVDGGTRRHCSPTPLALSAAVPARLVGEDGPDGGLMLRVEFAHVCFWMVGGRVSALQFELVCFQIGSLRHSCNKTQTHTRIYDHLCEFMDSGLKRKCTGACGCGLEVF